MSQRVKPITDDGELEESCPIANVPDSDATSMALAEPPRVTFKQRVAVFMASVKLNLCVLSIVVVTVTVDLPPEGFDAILAIFIVEAAIRFWAMGIRPYLLDPFCVLDLLLIVLEVICKALASESNVFAGRLAKFFKLFKFIKLLKGMRCVLYCFHKLTKQPERKMPPKGALAGWLSELDDNGDGRFSFEELQLILMKAHLTVSENQLKTMFNDIYSQNEGLLTELWTSEAMDLARDITHTHTDKDAEKTISIAEFEEYLHQLRPATSGQRFHGILVSCLKSWGFWFVSIFTMRGVVLSLGKPRLGPLRVYDAALRPEAISMILSWIGVIGQIGFIGLVLKGGAAKLDTFEDAERAIVNTFGGANAKAKPTAWKLKMKAANILGKNTRKSSFSKTNTVRRSSVVQTLDRHNELEKLDIPNAVLDIEQLRSLLQTHSIHMSDMALTKLFNKLDTSNDGLTSVRELTNFVSTWEPTTSEQRQLKIVGSMFGVVGFLETAYLLGFFLFTGNSYLWKNSTTPDTKFQIETLGVICFVLGNIGMIMVRYEFLESKHESLSATRHMLISAVSREGHSHSAKMGKQTTDTDLCSLMFQPEGSTESSKWVRRVLGGDIEQHCEISDDELGSWCDRLDRHPRYRHVKFLAALLEHGTPEDRKLTGVPNDVMYRLRNALKSEKDSPWQVRSVTLREFVQILQKNSIYLPLQSLEDVFNEIDSDRSGRITEVEFGAWTRSYRPLNHSEKRRVLMHTLVTTLGFYALCMPLVSCFFDFGPGRLWPIESSLTVAVSGYSRLLITVGNIEVQRMSWIPQALAFDQAEQCQLELKAGVECATDRIMHAKAAAAAAAATGMSAAAAAQRLVISTSTRGRV